MAPERGRDVDPLVLLSASGLSRLSDCEVRFLYRAPEDEPEAAKGRPLVLGTVVHELVEARLRGLDWRAHLDNLAPDFGWEPGYQMPDPLPTAEWLLARHEQVYPTLPTCVATENQFELWLPDAPVPTKVRGRMDGLVMLTTEEAWPHQPGVYVWETKTMGRWDRLDWLSVDPQLGTYVWAAREMGFVVQGVVYDAILTQHWKTEDGEVFKSGPRKGQAKDTHPAEDSFQRLVIPTSEPLVTATLDTYRKAAARIAEITADPERAVKAMGRGCVWCPAFSSCHPYGSR